jgi:hypothetical protein
VAGGHFLSYSSMQATMQNRLIYKYGSESITNNDHPHVEHSIMVMAKTIREQLRGRGKRSQSKSTVQLLTVLLVLQRGNFSSLAAMVFWPQVFRAEDQSPSADHEQASPPEKRDATELRDTDIDYDAQFVDIVNDARTVLSAVCRSNFISEEDVWKEMQLIASGAYPEHLHVGIVKIS